MSKVEVKNLTKKFGDLLVLDKPSGISCHPGRGHYDDSLGGQAAAYLARPPS